MRTPTLVLASKRYSALGPRNDFADGVNLVVQALESDTLAEVSGGVEGDQWLVLAG